MRGNFLIFWSLKISELEKFLSEDGVKMVLGEDEGRRGGGR